MKPNEYRLTLTGGGFDKDKREHINNYAWRHPVGTEGENLPEVLYGAPEDVLVMPSEPSEEVLCAIREAITYAKRISSDEAAIVYSAIVSTIIKGK